MTKSSKTLRVLLVGAGRRIQNNFLPALRCLPQEFEVSGIHARNWHNLESVAQHWGIASVRSLAEFVLDEVDVVAISVPTSQNANVLRQLSGRGKHLHIVIDTPIAWSNQEYDECAPLLREFESITVTEDYMNFPRFGLARKVIRRGLIGEIRSLTLTNTGFLYHGLALIRSFVGFVPVISTWTRSLSSHASVVGYEFGGDFHATVIGPYRRHTSGGLFVEGTRGVLTEFPADQGAIGAPTYLLSEVTTDGVLSGFEVRGDDLLETLELPDLGRMRAMDFPDRSDFNLERGCGLIEVLRSLADHRGINGNYGAANAFYDSFVSRRAGAGETPLDPFNCLAVADTASERWIARTDTFLKRSSVAAAVLPSDQKIAVPHGTLIETSRSETREGHLLLREVALNGRQLSTTPWFIFEPHWAPQTSP